MYILYAHIILTKLTQIYILLGALSDSKETYITGLAFMFITNIIVFAYYTLVDVTKFNSTKKRVLIGTVVFISGLLCVACILPPVAHYCQNEKPAEQVPLCHVANDPHISAVNIKSQ